MKYRPYAAAFQPMKMTGDELTKEIRSGWGFAYSPAAIYSRLLRTRNRPFFERLIVFVANLCFRGVFFPQMNWRAWVQLFWENKRSFYEIFFRSRSWTKRAHLNPLPEQVKLEENIAV